MGVSPTIHLKLVVWGSKYFIVRNHYHRLEEASNSIHFNRVQTRYSTRIIQALHIRLLHQDLIDVYCRVHSKECPHDANPHQLAENLAEDHWKQHIFHPKALFFMVIYHGRKSKITLQKLQVFCCFSFPYH